MAIKQIRLRVGPEGTEQLRLLTREIQALATLKVPLTTSVDPTAPPLAGGGGPGVLPNKFVLLFVRPVPLPFTTF